MQSTERDLKMFHAALASILLMYVYKFMKTNNQYEMDWWMAFIIMSISSLLNGFVSITWLMAELHDGFLVIGYLIYFLVPFLLLKVGLKFVTKTAFKFAIVVPIVAIVATLPFEIVNVMNGR